MVRAMAKRITWWRLTAEIMGISERHMRRWRERYKEFGYDGLFDRRRHQPVLFVRSSTTSFTVPSRGRVCDQPSNRHIAKLLPEKVMRYRDLITKLDANEEGRPLTLVQLFPACPIVMSG
jgi:hypothetical protein